MEFVKNVQSFLQSCNKSVINQACSGPHWENISPRSFLYGPRCARSALSRPRADILPVRPSRLVNKRLIFSRKMQAIVYLNRFDIQRSCLENYFLFLGSNWLFRCYAQIKRNVLPEGTDGQTMKTTLHNQDLTDLAQTSQRELLSISFV